MNACRKFRKEIALSRLERSVNRELEAHLARCEACRAYAAELAAVCAEHDLRAEALPDFETPLKLRQRVARAIREEERQTRLWMLANRKIQIAGAVAVLVLVAVAVRQRSNEEAPRGVTNSATPTPLVEAQLVQPSYGMYRSAFTRSAEDLEVALVRNHVTGDGPREIFKLSSGLPNVP